MERRVTALGNDMREIKTDLKRLIADFADMKRDIGELKRDVFGMKLDVAEIKGRLSQTPTTIQLLSLVFWNNGGGVCGVEIYRSPIGTLA
jgi:hypothetical protein